MQVDSVRWQVPAQRSSFGVDNRDAAAHTAATRSGVDGAFE